MKRLLCETVADKGSVVINGISFPLGDDGCKSVILTDEITPTYPKVWIDLRDTDINVWYSDCSNKKVFTFTKEDLGCWFVELTWDRDDDVLYLVKYE